MDLSLSSRFKNAWNAFRNRAPTMMSQNIGSGYSYRPDRFRLTRGNERSIVTSVYNRIALDVAAINIQHVQLDDEGRFLNVIKSGLNECLSLEANLDQTGRAFIQDVVMSMMDEGCVAMRRIGKRKYHPTQKKKKLRTRPMLKVKEQKLAPNSKQRLSLLEKLTKRQKPTLTLHMNKRIRMNSIKFSLSTRRLRNQRKNLPAHQRRHRIRYRTISENKGGKSK